MGQRLSASGIYRLGLYHRYLSNLDRHENEYVSSQELADATGHTAAQVRKDLSSYGSLGAPGKGYEIRNLKAVLTKILGKEKVRNVVLVGVGNLGLALIAHKGLPLQRFNIVAAFDKDIRKIGRRVEDVFIHDIRDLNSMIAGTNAQIAIVSVPASAAQEVIDALASAGIKAILNFAPARVVVPEGVELQNVDISIELDRLCYLLNNPC